MRIPGLISSMLILALMSCRAKNDVHVDYSVIIIKEVDSLPCQATIVYSDYGSEINYEHEGPVTGNWYCSKLCYYDTEVDLKATAVSNIKSLTVRIMSKGTTVVDTCNGTNCSAYVSKALYNN